VPKVQIHARLEIRAASAIDATFFVSNATGSTTIKFGFGTTRCALRAARCAVDD
jgi:hypothetical protein